MQEKKTRVFQFQSFLHYVELQNEIRSGDCTKGALSWVYYANFNAFTIHFVFTSRESEILFTTSLFQYEFRMCSFQARNSPISTKVPKMQMPISNLVT